VKREEFLKELENLLADIPAEEREEALNYYSSYFEDAGISKESEVIKELGSPKQVAKVIEADLKAGSIDYTYSVKTEKRPEANSDENASRNKAVYGKDNIYSSERIKKDYKSGAHIDTESGADTGYTNTEYSSAGYSNAGYTNSARRNVNSSNSDYSGGGSFLGIIIAILCLPFVFALVMFIFSIAFTIIMILISLVISGGAVAISGVGVFIGGFATLIASLPLGLVLIGVGLIMVTIGVAVTIGLIQLCRFIFPGVFRVVGKIVGEIGNVYSRTFRGKVV